MGNKKKKCIIIKDEKILKAIHNACDDYFSKLPEDKLKEVFRLILNNT